MTSSLCVDVEDVLCAYIFTCLSDVVFLCVVCLHKFACIASRTMQMVCFDGEFWVAFKVTVPEFVMWNEFLLV